MIIAEMRPRYVPVKVLRFQVQCEHVGKKNSERAGNFLNGAGFQIGRRVERSHPPRPCILDVHDLSLLLSHKLSNLIPLGKSADTI